MPFIFLVYLLEWSDHLNKTTSFFRWQWWSYFSYWGFSVILKVDIIKFLKRLLSWGVEVIFSDLHSTVTLFLVSDILYWRHDLDQRILPQQMWIILIQFPNLTSNRHYPGRGQCQGQGHMVKVTVTIKVTQEPVDTKRKSVLRRAAMTLMMMTMIQMMIELWPFFW